MPGSFAFQPIQDPSDPAWEGYAEPVHVPWWRHAGFYWMTCVVIFPVVIAVALGVGSGPAKGDAVTASQSVGAAAGTSQLPVIATGETAAAPGAIPRLDETAPVIATSVPAGAAEGGSVESGEWGPLDASYAPPMPWPNSLATIASTSLTGDLDGLEPRLLATLQVLATRLGVRLDVISGRRTRGEQTTLFQRFLSGTGNLAAVPGTSRHESGDAADAYIDGVALADVPGASALAESLGLGFPVPGEAWHVELVPPVS